MTFARYLTLKGAGLYLGGRSPRWIRRHILGAIPYNQPPSSGPHFLRTDLDAFMEKHRKVPPDLDQVVASVLKGSGRGRKK